MQTQNKYSVTPPHPPYKEKHRDKKKRRILIVFLILIIQVVKAQEKEEGFKTDTVKIVGFEELVRSLQVHYEEKAAYELGEFNYEERWKWFQYLPSFGWNFISNTPFIGYNTTDVFNAINYNRKKNAQLRNILHTINEDYLRSSISLKLKYDIFGTKKALFEQKLYIIDIEETYFKIHQELYKKHDLSPSNYLQKKIAYEYKKLELLQLKADLELLKEEIFLLARYGQADYLFKSVEDVPKLRD